MDLLEGLNLTVYKKLVAVFSTFVEQNPGSGMGNIYRALLDTGLKSVPTDKRALSILKYILGNKVGSPAIVQDIMNTTLSGLPITLRPVYKSGTSKLTAFYNRDGKIYTRMLDLLDLEATGKSGTWTAEDGTKVKLLDLEV